MFIMISYDISDNRVRKKVSDVLKNYGIRVQKSVFECIVGQKQVDDIIEKVSALIHLKTDKIRFYSLCEGCRSRTEIDGWGEIAEDEEFIII